MVNKQRSIAKEARLSGTGLHTGHAVNIIFKPAVAGQGINFVRTDLAEKPMIRLGSFDVVYGGAAGRYSGLKIGSGIIYTVEHMMSALAGLGIDNIIIEMDNDEPPGLDGSAALYVKALQEAGIVEFDAEKIFFEVKEAITVERQGSCVTILPFDGFKVSYALEYPNPHLRQVASASVGTEAYARDIAPARTFCLQEEAEAIKEKGLGRGANYTNTLVFGPEGVLDNKLRFPDEPARHKILDCIGDLYLLGVPIKGHVIAFKGGHNLNRELLKKVAQQKVRYESRRVMTAAPASGDGACDIHAIMNAIPHRYPFLLVDRIVELKQGVRAVGIKNVTVNEGFFQGHFPQRPVMPGVLMVEAMAQVGGVCMLTNPEMKGKLAFFVAIEGVKFRKVVEPGDQLVMEVDIVKSRSRIAQSKGVAKVNGEVVCEASMTFAFGE